jgi:hypothetical protein
MRLCCYTEQQFVITEVRNEIHSLQLFHMARKDCIYTSITSRSWDCGIIVHREASFNVTWYTIKHISCGCDDVTVLLSQEKRAHRVRLRHIHVKIQDFATQMVNSKYKQICLMFTTNMSITIYVIQWYNSLQWKGKCKSSRNHSDISRMGCI